ncbi:MAG: hypothetical protein FDX30_00290 [Chlorobium sp.]|nr:MAG: hypothetical protein FDX30_00290 [Chlorobium sp.]
MKRVSGNLANNPCRPSVHRSIDRINRFHWNRFSGKGLRSLTVPLASAGLLLFQLTLPPVLNHNTFGAEKKKIILEHSDSIEGEQSERNSYNTVSGNVLFRHNNMSLRCDRATDFGQEKRIVLSGNIVIGSSNFEIYGDSGVYYPDRETGELSGNIRGRLIDKPLSAKGQQAVFNKASNLVWLNGDAIAWYDRQQISGDVVVLHLKESGKAKESMTIDRIQVEGNAFFASGSAPGELPAVFDQIGGKKMVILLDDESKIKGITVSGQAEILYHIYDENHRPSGINYSSGDEIRIFFSEGELKRVKVTGSVEGKHYPQRFWQDRGIDLQKFAWRENENPFRQQKSLP